MHLTIFQLFAMFARWVDKFPVNFALLVRRSIDTRANELRRTKNNISQKKTKTQQNKTRNARDNDLQIFQRISHTRLQITLFR